MPTTADVTRAGSQRALCLAVAIVLALAAPAGATSDPNGPTAAPLRTTTSVGPFVLDAGRVVLPTDQTLDTSGGQETVRLGLSRLGASGRWKTVALTPATGLFAPVLANAGDKIAAGWNGPGAIDSALAGATGGHVGSPVNVAAVDGTPFDLAATADHSRAITWSPQATMLSAVGVDVEIFSAAGTTVGPIALSTDPVYGVAISSDDRGGWWAVWGDTSLGVRAAHVSRTGAAGPPVSVATTQQDVTNSGSPLLGAFSTRPWRLVADRRGGLWVALARRVVHVTTSGAQTMLTSNHSLIVASGDGMTAVLQTLDHQHLAVRRLGATLGPSVVLRHHGHAIDVAVDARRHTIEVLSADVEAFGLFGADRLSEIGTHSQHSSVLKPCGDDGLLGQVLADNGVVGVSCASSDTDSINTEFEGYGKDGRNDNYLLIRGGRIVNHTKYFEGIVDSA